MKNLIPLQRIEGDLTDKILIDSINGDYSIWDSRAPHFSGNSNFIPDLQMASYQCELSIKVIDHLKELVFLGMKPRYYILEQTVGSRDFGRYFEANYEVSFFQDSNNPKETPKE